MILAPSESHLLKPCYRIVVLVLSDSRRVMGKFLVLWLEEVIGGWWCDIQTNLDVTDTGVKLLPEYYRDGGRYSTESHE